MQKRVGYCEPLTSRSLSGLCALLARWLVLICLLALMGCAASLGSGGAPSASVTGNTRSDEPASAGPDGAQPVIEDTGVIGTLTGFGSIIVNGFELDYAPDLPVIFKGRTVRPDILRIGQVVAVEMERRGTRLQARWLKVRHEVAGPIERIDPARRMAVVFGQRIEIPQGIISAANGLAPASIRDLAVGDHIDVSGLRRANGVIAASRIDKTGPGEAAVLRGRVTASGQSSFSVNGVRIDTPIENRPGRLASGRDVEIIGTAVQGRLQATRITLLRALPFSGQVRRVSVEGYVRRAIAGGVAIGRVPVSQLPARARIEARQRIIFDGSIDARGRFAPTRVRIPQNNAQLSDARRRTQVRQPYTPPPVIRAPVPSPPAVRR